ncbi:hypothetical protein UT4_20740 [Ferrigenium sp. UT4]
MGLGAILQDLTPMFAIIGGNLETGGVAGSGMASHGKYGPNVLEKDRQKFWGSTQGSVAVPVTPSRGAH